MAEDKTLRDVPVGQSATVRRLVGEGAIKRRIMDMGITKGTDIYVRKVAPLGDPIEVTVRGFELSLRKNEAQNVLVSSGSHTPPLRPRAHFFSPLVSFI